MQLHAVCNFNIREKKLFTNRKKDCKFNLVREKKTGSYLLLDGLRFTSVWTLTLRVVHGVSVAEFCVSSGGHEVVFY